VFGEVKSVAGKEWQLMMSTSGSTRIVSFSLLEIAASVQTPQFAAEVPDLIGEIQRLITAREIRDYLNHLERTRYLAPQEVDLEPEPDEDPEEEDVWLEKPVRGAGFSRIMIRASHQDFNHRTALFQRLHCV
jgi:hypothetical protein